MVQLIITVAIIACALGFGIYRAVRSMRNPVRGCEGCDQDCGVCTPEQMKKLAAERKRANHSKPS